MKKELFSIVLYLSCLPTLLAGQLDTSEHLFAQFATGQDITTYFTVHNPTTGELPVAIDLFRTSKLGGGKFFETGISLDPGATETLEFTSETPITGWAKLTSNRAFSASEFFRIGPGDKIVAEVGVPSTMPTGSFKVFGFKNPTTATNTGVAIANPSERAPSQVTARQLDKSGRELDHRTFNLEPLQHFAANINESPLFEGTEEYEGTIEFQATSPVVPVALRQDGFVTTSTPVVGQQALNPLTQNPLAPTGRTIGGPGFVEVEDRVDLWSSQLRDVPGDGVAPKASPRDICFTFNFVERDSQAVVVQLWIARDGGSHLGIFKIFDDTVAVNSTRTWCHDNAYWLRVLHGSSGEIPTFYWRVDTAPSEIVTE